MPTSGRAGRANGDVSLTCAGKAKQVVAVDLGQAIESGHAGCASTRGCSDGIFTRRPGIAQASLTNPAIGQTVSGPQKALAVLTAVEQTSGMRNTEFDFTKLSIAERIQLAEDLWDSIPPRGRTSP